MTYLAFAFAGRSLGASDLVLQCNTVDVGKAAGRGEVRLLLSKVELHGAVLHQHVGEERAARQLLLGGLERYAQLHAVLGESHLYLITLVKVLPILWQVLAF